MLSESDSVIPAMSHPAILDPNQTYTFSKFFELNADAEELFAEFGVRLENQNLGLPQASQTPPFLATLEARINRSLQLIDLTTEIARREMLIAPILFEVCSQTNQKIKIEYAVNVSNWLRGSLDYLIPSEYQLLVIEAKQADIARGFVQLGTELIALDQWTNSTVPRIYGAVTTGDIWKFGYLDRAQKVLYKDTNIYAVPSNLELLLSILLGIIGNADKP
jgi:hypothetical protein